MEHQAKPERFGPEMGSIANLAVPCGNLPHRFEQTNCVAGFSISVGLVARQHGPVARATYLIN